MERTFFSTAEHMKERIDCRCLSLMVEFYFLSENDVLGLTRDVIEWMARNLSDGFVVRRYVDKRNTSLDKALKTVKCELDSRHSVFYSEEAMAVSSAVYNVNTFKRYIRNVRYDILGDRLDVPSDYRDFWNHLFPNEKIDSEIIKHNVLRIFREEGRIKTSKFVLPDVQTSLSVLPYSGISNCYYGTYSASFSAFCLNTQVDDVAEDWAQFAEYLSQTYVKLNARVMLQPPVGTQRNPYMTIFGLNGNIDGSHIGAKCAESEWYPTYYLQGVEWFNVVSPLAAQHIQHFSKDTTPVFISLRNGPEGNLIIKSLTPISQFDIADSLEIKKIVYSALFPGMTYIRLRTLFHDNLAKERMIMFPRNDWAIIPIFEHEIDIVGTNLVFAAKNLYDI